jgi:hypothetical protein
MGIEQNNYIVWVPGRPHLTVRYISRKHAFRAVEKYRNDGHGAVVELLGEGFDKGEYEDWDNE